MSIIIANQHTFICSAKFIIEFRFPIQLHPCFFLNFLDVHVRLDQTSDDIQTVFIFKEARVPFVRVLLVASKILVIYFQGRNFHGETSAYSKICKILGIKVFSIRREKQIVR